MLERIRQRAAPFLDGDEIVHCAFYGQTGMPTGYAALGALVGQAMFVIVVATDRNVYIFRRGLFASPRIRSLLTTHRIEPHTKVSFSRGAMQIDSQTYWVAALLAQQEARSLVDYVLSIREAKRARAVGTDAAGPG